MPPTPASSSVPSNALRNVRAPPGAARYESDTHQSGKDRLRHSSSVVATSLKT